MLKIYASNPNKSRGRLHKITECSPNDNFQYDRDQILLSSSFRRLEYKTQVFVNHEGDHYRTRLTHSLEVSLIARKITRLLGACEELSECLALAHDLGHPPFGHAGERALNEMMKDYGGFDHNIHTIKILTKLEKTFVEYNGLNISIESLEGIIKHNGPIKDKNKIKAINKLCGKLDLMLDKFAGIEAQIASLADDIAYHNHDIEDGLRAGFFKISDLLELPLIGKIYKNIKKQYPEIDKYRLIKEAKRRFTNYMIDDLMRITNANIKKHHIETVDDIRNLGFPLVNFSEELQEINLILKDFLYKNMYRHYKINRMTSKAKRVIKQLFELFFNEPECLPTKWRALYDKPNTKKTAHVVCDFIAGMTDRYALEIYESFYK